MTLHADIMNIPCLPIAGTELEILAFRLGHEQAILAAAELVERAAQQEINSALDDDEPASLSKAMAFLESNAAQGRREQKLRDEVEALAIKADQLKRLNAVLFKEVIDSAEIAASFRNGNTVLIEVLMDMVNQFFHEGKGGFLHHSFMTSEEGAIETLIEAGFAEEVGPNSYRLFWDKLELRKTRKTPTPAGESA